MIGQVFLGEQPFPSLHVLGNRPGDDALVEHVASALRDQLERGRQLRVLEHVAGRGRLAVDEERRRGIRVLGEQRLHALPLVRDDLADRVAVARVLDRRLQCLRQRPRAVLREQLAPAVHHARHADRELPAQRQALDVAFLELLWRRRRRRASARVQPVDFPVFRAVDDREEIAAGAVHRRLDDGQHRRGRDRGVDGVAARLQHPKAGGRGQRLAGGDGAVPRHDDGSGAARVAGGTISCGLLHKEGGHDECECWTHRRILPRVTPGSGLRLLVGKTQT